MENSFSELEMLVSMNIVFLDVDYAISVQK